MAKLTRNLFIPCIDTSAAKDYSGFVPFDKSTIFEMAWNPETETYQYICSASNSTEVTSFSITLPQEIILDNSNPMFVWLYDFCMSMPTGSSAEVPILLVEPDMTTGTATRGRLWANASVQPNTLNTVDGKLSVTLALNGDMTTGDVAITESGGTKQFTFTADSETATYTAVTPEGTENPYEEGWYKRVGGSGTTADPYVYMLTADTEVESGNTYYTKS